MDSDATGAAEPFRRVLRVRAQLVDPTTNEILDFCARDPIERVFLEEVARRSLGRFVGLLDGEELVGLCHVGVNAVPSGRGCAAFARDVVRASPRMLIGEAGAVGELWEEIRAKLPRPRQDRPRQPVFVIRESPEPGFTGLRAATFDDLELLLPACAAAHAEELGVDPMRRDPEGFRWRTRAQIEDGRSWIWEEDGLIRFKAEASAWTPSAVQLQQVWVDPPARRRGYATRALRDLLRDLLARVPAVCLFVRGENIAAIRLYETVGMKHVLDYRSVLL
ncbi:MAG: GNAT family N-acetyltransferase [Actinobacteria bacterium]|nr:MAG: GNAT family N-acetyltransferase [Actinomycetota bacterium]